MKPDNSPPSTKTPNLPPESSFRSTESLSDAPLVQSMMDAPSEAEGRGDSAPAGRVVAESDSMGDSSSSFPEAGVETLRPKCSSTPPLKDSFVPTLAGKEPHGKSA